MNNSESSKLHFCNKTAAAKLAAGVLSLGVARELLDVMAATPSAFVRMALCMLSGTALVSALAGNKSEGGQIGIAQEAVTETVSGKAVSAAVIRRRVTGSSHRLWTRADGFTLSGARS